MKKTSLLFLFVLLLNSTFSQKSLKYFSKSDALSTDGKNYFLITEKPVSNKEYLTYILWNLNCYLDYPDRFLSCIPGLKITDKYAFEDEMSLSDNPFEVIFKSSPEYVKDYIFNPIFFDYPVIGISVQQAIDYNKWLADRYNEYLLIKRKYFEADFNFFGENCFVTESCLVGQYEGIRKKPGELSPEIIMTVANFRLPIKKELNYAKKNNAVSDKLISYKKDNNVFLDLWTDHFIDRTETGMTINNPYGSEESNPTITFIPAENSFDPAELKCEELTLDECSPTNVENAVEAWKMNNYEIKQTDLFKDGDGNFIQKDRFGYMPFMIIDTDDSGQWIIIGKTEGPEPENCGEDKLFLFRSVLNLKNRD